MKTIERRIADIERALDVRPIVLVISCKPLSPDDWRAAVAAARCEAGIAHGVPAIEYNVCTGVSGN